MTETKDLQWLQLCEAGAQIFSTCAKRQYMAIIVDAQGRIAGQGYNGVPSKMKHCKDGGCPRYMNNVPSGTPYDTPEGLCFSQHAEQGALSHGDGTRYSGATLYVNGIPCFNCAKAIAGAGITRIVCRSEERINQEFAQKLYEESGITFINLS